MTPARRWPTLLAAAVMLLAASCGDSPDPAPDGPDTPAASDGGQMDPDTELQDRPGFAEAATGYVDLLTEVRAALGRVAPSVEWDTTAPVKEAESLCRPPFHVVDGAQSAGFATGGIGAIPDDDWDEAVERVGELLAQEGYGEPTVLADEPGNHNVTFRGPFDATLFLSGQRNTSLTLRGGCFLTSEG